MPPQDEFQELDAAAPAGFTDRVAFHMLFKRISHVTPDEVCEMIREGQPLFGRVPDDEWPRWQRRINRLNLAKHVTHARFLAEFQDRRPDLYEAGMAEPLGPTWFSSQVTSLRINLGIDTLTPVRYVKISSPS